MARELEACAGPCVRGTSGPGYTISVLAMALFLMLPVSGAWAQENGPPGTQPPGDLCQVFTIDVSEGQPKDLRASCRGRGLMLGSVTSFEVSQNESLKATLVDLHSGADRRVLLLTIQDDGIPLVEDLTGQIALEAGRGPMSAIDEVGLDLRAFGQTGEIGIQPAARERGAESSARIDLATQIAAERTRRSAVGAQGRE